MIPGAFGSEITKIPHMDEVLRRHRAFGNWPVTAAPVPNEQF